MQRSSVAGLVIAGAAGPLSIYTAQPLLPLIAHDFGLEPSQAGLSLAAPTIALALMAPFAGTLSDRLGRKPLIVAALLLMIVPTLLAASAPSFQWLVFWQFVGGLLIPGVTTVAVAYAGEESPPEQVSGIIATVISANVAGGFIGRFVSATVASHGGWPASFHAIAALQALAALGIIALLPASRNFTRGGSFAAAFVTMAGHLARPRLVAVFLTGACILYAIVGVFTYAGYRLMAQPFGWTPAQVGFLYLLYLLSIPVNPWAGRRINSYGPRRVLVIAAGVAALGLLVTLARPTPFLVGGLALFIIAIFICQSAATSQVAQSAKTGRAAAMGLYSTAYYIGGGLGAVIPGFLWAAGGWPATVAGFLAITALAAALARFGWKGPGG